ncbi:MAG: hypothetical protein WCG47_10800 [Dermatophilaceae bacterium]
MSLGLTTFFKGGGHGDSLDQVSDVSAYLRHGWHGPIASWPHPLRGMRGRSTRTTIGGLGRE